MLVGVAGTVEDSNDVSTLDGKACTEEDELTTGLVKGKEYRGLDKRFS